MAAHRGCADCQPAGHQRQRRIQRSGYCPADTVSAGERCHTEKLHFVTIPINKKAPGPEGHRRTNWNLFILLIIT